MQQALFTYPVPTDEAVRFFYEHSGFSYDPRTETPEKGRRRCARNDAHAEAWATAHGWSLDYEVDYNAIWDDDVPREHTDYDQYVVILKDVDGHELSAIGSVDLGPDGDPDTDPYMRVLFAELASEQMS